MIMSIQQLCHDSNNGDDYKPERLLDDLKKEDVVGGDPTKWEDKPPRKQHSYCALKGYYGPVGYGNETNVSQIRVKRCGTEETGVKDVIALMYHILYDYCVEGFIFRTNIKNKKMKNKKKDENVMKLNVKMLGFIKDDLSAYVPSLKIVILSECIVRVKMTLFLRILQLVCCLGESEIDNYHWNPLQRLCEFLDNMYIYKSELYYENIDGDEDDDEDEDEDEDKDEDEDGDEVRIAKKRRTS